MNVSFLNLAFITKATNFRDNLYLSGPTACYVGSPNRQCTSTHTPRHHNVPSPESVLSEPYLKIFRREPPASQDQALVRKLSNLGRSGSHLHAEVNSRVSSLKVQITTSQDKGKRHVKFDRWCEGAVMNAAISRTLLGRHRAHCNEGCESLLPGSVPFIYSCIDACLTYACQFGDYGDIWLRYDGQRSKQV